MGRRALLEDACWPHHSTKRLPALLQYQSLLQGPNKPCLSLTKSMSWLTVIQHHMPVGSYSGFQAKLKIVHFTLQYQT